METLISQLSEDRDYGERTYEQVVSDVREGRLIISVGQNLPQLVDAKSRKAVKGTGKPVGAGTGPQHRALWEFRARALDDFDAAYEELREGMQKGDPRMHKIFWENLLGRMDVARDSGMSDVVKLLLEQLTASQSTSYRKVDIDVG